MTTSIQYDSGAGALSDQSLVKGMTKSKGQHSEYGVADMEKSESTMDENLTFEEIDPVADPPNSAMKWKARLQLCSLYFVLFLAGWDGGTAGPLIPRMQEVYNVNHSLRPRLNQYSS